MDEIDRASYYEQMLVAAAISTACTIANEPIQKSKICLNCGESTQEGLRWCSPECREDGIKRTNMTGGIL